MNALQSSVSFASGPPPHHVSVAVLSNVPACRDHHEERRTRDE
jgi:hypothetical protein